ncbi:hypothetical protein GCM10023149_30760 [Mucilaginibacter gynuensis]|uniref:Uncharacterized protein n=1 Tax=Mucilaginibacter gynuensis TaxID=1302236 RepID=A0ABP8GN37_9SPHI
MNHISFTHQGKFHAFAGPSKWNEVTAGQLLAWLNVLYANDDEEAKLAKAVPVFYGIGSKLYKAIRPYQRLQIAPTLRGLFSENKLDVWLMPSFRLRFKKYYGPADKLSNLTADEFFNYCEPLYWQYKATNDEAKLNALCAVLYRPKRKGAVNDDIREPITEAGIAKRARLFKKLPLGYKLAIYFNYTGCRNFVTGMHAKAFDKGSGESKKRGDVTLSVAGGPLGNHTETKKTNLYTFLLHLVNLIEQEDELKRKMK